MATKAVVAEGAARLSMCLCQLMELLFQRVRKYSGTAKSPLFHSYFGALLSGPHPRHHSFLLGTRLTSRPLCMNVNRCSESMQNRIINDVFCGSFLPSAMQQRGRLEWLSLLGKTSFSVGGGRSTGNTFQRSPRMNREGFYSMLIERQS